jgi:DNA-binding MarR family transcriptional regulator
LSKESEHGDRSPAERVAGRARAVYREATALAAGFAADTGVGATDAGALAALDAAAAGPLTASELGRQLGLSSGAVTKLIDRLEGAGMVARRRDTADRRRVYVTLTDKARAVGAARLAPIGARIEAAVAALDDAELETVDRFLGALLHQERAPETTGGPSTSQSSSTSATSPTPRTMPTAVSPASARRSGSA